METRKRSGGVYGFYVFVSFSFIWDEWVVMDIILDIGWMWGKGVTKQWGLGGILVVESEEKRTRRQISGGWRGEKKGGKRLDFWAIAKVLNNPLHYVLWYTWILSKRWIWTFMTRGMMKTLGISRIVCSLLNVCVLGRFLCECCWLAYHERAP